MNKIVIYLFILIGPIVQGCSSASKNSNKSVKKDFNQESQEWSDLLHESNDFFMHDQKKKMASNSLDSIGRISFLCGVGNFTSAKQVSQKLTEKNKANPNFWNELGICYSRQNNIRLATLYFNKAIELDRDFYPAYNNMGINLLKKKQFQSALEAFKLAHEKGKFSTIPKINEAILYLKFGYHDKATKVLRALYNKYPENDRVKLMTAILFKANGEDEKSHNLLNALKRETGNDSTAKYLHLQYLYSVGDFKKVIEELNLRNNQEGSIIQEEVANLRKSAEEKVSEF